MLIERCDFWGPVVPSIVIDGTTASCPACGEVVYPDLRVLRDHVFHNWGTAARWYSTGMGVLVHACGDRTASYSESVDAMSAVLDGRRPLFERLAVDD